MKKITLKILFVVMAFCTSVEVWAQKYNYQEVLQKSQFFYEAQRSGELPSDNRVTWRGNSGLTDGADVGKDLTGGWYDAGDHIKFGLPMAFSATALNWGYLEYTDGYIQAGEVDQFKKNMRWVSDYFVKCHTAPNEFYGQVSAKDPDHSFWIAAELVDDSYTRKSYKIDTANPGTDLACETAAALASASIVFKDSDPAYSATLLQHAKELYAFGDQYRGEYTGSIPAENTYPSSGYIDELVWGALWLYKATNDVAYLNKAIAEYDNIVSDFLWSLVWDDKTYGAMVMLAIITGEQRYKTDSERHLDFWMQGGGVTYSPGGLAWLFQWGSLRHTSNAALTAFIYSDNVDTPKKTEYHDLQ